MRFIKDAWNERKDNYKYNENLTIGVIQETIDIKIKSFELLIENRNSKIYKVYTVYKQALILKVSKTLSEEEMQTEYLNLKYLTKFNSNIYVAPKVYGINYEYKFYVMDYIDGLSISDLIIQKKSDKDILNACIASARAIAIIHSEWFSSNPKYVNLKKLFEDLENYSSSLTKEELKTLKKNRVFLKDRTYPYGLVYRDFDVLNIYFNNDKVSLIDPPENPVKSILYWDLATFTVGLTKASMKSLNRKNNKSNIRKYRNAFLNEYIQAQTKIEINKDDFFYIIKLFELQRLSQLIVFQKKHQKVNFILSKSYLINTIAIYLLQQEAKKIIKDLKVNNIE